MTTYYFHSQYKALPLPDKDGKTKGGKYYRCYKGSEKVIEFCSFNFRTGTAAFIFNSCSPTTPDYSLRLKKTFPVTGKIDLIEYRTKRHLGQVTRGGKCLDAKGNLVARFIDPTSWKDHFGESAMDIFTQVAFGADSTDAPGGGPNQFGLIYGDLPAGSLVREQLPFFPDPPRRSEPSKVRKVLKKVLPKKFGSALFDISPPSGWKLSLTEKIDPKDSNLLLYCGLMTIEIRSW